MRLPDNGNAVMRPVVDSTNRTVCNGASASIPIQEAAGLGKMRKVWVADPVGVSADKQGPETLKMP